MVAFSDLMPAQKVLAILAKTPEPITLELAMEFAGIDPDTLEEDDRLAIESVLEGPTVQRESNTNKYAVIETSRAATLDGLEITAKDVARQLVKVLSEITFDSEPNDEGQVSKETNPPTSIIGEIKG